MGLPEVTGGDQTDEALDETARQSTVCHLLDGWNVAHNRLVAGSSPAGPTSFLASLVTYGVRLRRTPSSRDGSLGGGQWGWLAGLIVEAGRDPLTGRRRQVSRLFHGNLRDAKKERI